MSYFENDDEILKKFIKGLVFKEYKKDTILFSEGYLLIKILSLIGHATYYLKEIANNFIKLKRTKE